MADTTTTTYAFIKPEVGGASDTWGTSLNTDWDKVDQLLSGVLPLLAGIKINSNTNATLALNDTDATLGAAMTGRLNFQSTGASAGFIGYNAGTAITLQNNVGAILFEADPSNTVSGTNIGFSIDGANAARVEVAGTVSPNAFSLITREKGDTRYAVLSGPNTFDTSPTVANAAPQVALQDTDMTPVSGTSTAQFTLRASDNSVMGAVGYQSSAVLSLVNNNNNVSLSADPNSTLGAGVGYTSFRVNGTECARMNAVGTTMGSTLTVATREKGDVRWAAISDTRLKTNVAPMGSVLSLVGQLTPVNYSWLAPSVARPEGPRLGVIAQDIQSVFPDAVIEWEDDILGVDTLALIGILLKSVQELTARVAALESV